MTWTTQELMIAATAREIGNGEVVFVGMRLPIMAFGVAKLTHAPNAVGLFECGIVRDTPSKEMLYTMADPPNQLGAAWSAGLLPVMAQLPSGHVDAGFIGGAEIDRFGNINTSCIGDFRNPRVRLPGSGGAADIAAMSKRTIAIMNHERRRLVERVSFVTSPGNLEGRSSRDALRLPGGPAALITDRSILRPHGPEGELHLHSLHTGESVDSVQEHTGWNLKLYPELCETPPPSADELEALHQLDPEGFWR
ncbi:MAG: CoA-transferase [SAR324 cluster bacterium]|nr:CoA-transferase [SAR324 cluster bacterium]